MEEAAAAQRIERVEKRKVEMSMSSKAPGIGNGSSRRKVAAEKYEPKKVEDPDRVAARLAGQQKKWDAKIEEIKVILIGSLVTRHHTETRRQHVSGRRAWLLI